MFLTQKPIKSSYKHFRPFEYYLSSTSEIIWIKVRSYVVTWKVWNDRIIVSSAQYLTKKKKSIQENPDLILLHCS